MKKSSRASLLGAATSNSSMAATLAAYHATTGSWRGMLEELQVGIDGIGLGFTNPCLLVLLQGPFPAAAAAAALNPTLLRAAVAEAFRYYGWGGKLFKSGKTPEHTAIHTS